MSTKGIIFSAPMVRALLAGRKTQTRRLIKPKTGPMEPGDILVSWPADSFIRQGAKFRPPYAPGDRLYVREAWAKDDLIPNGVRYVATDAIHELRKKRPSIHMPRWASRLWLEVTEVRVQRLQDISEADAIAEGIVWQEPTEEDLQWAVDQAVEYGTSADVQGVWNTLHTAPGTRWQDNPWIVAVSFPVHHGNVDEVAA